MPAAPDDAPAVRAAGGRLRLRDRIGLVTIATVLLVALMVLEPRTASPLERLVNVEADGPGPIYNVPIDVGAIRRARSVLPKDAVYYIHPPAGAHSSALFHDILGTAYHYLLPSVPARDLTRARWVLSYQAPTLLPPGVRAARVHRVGNRVFVVELAR
jgi:hypothetical protein